MVGRAERPIKRSAVASVPAKKPSQVAPSRPAAALTAEDGTPPAIDLSDTIAELMVELIIRRWIDCEDHIHGRHWQILEPKLRTAMELLALISEREDLGHSEEQAWNSIDAARAFYRGEFSALQSLLNEAALQELLRRVKLVPVPPLPEKITHGPPT